MPKSWWAFLLSKPYSSGESIGNLTTIYPISCVTIEKMGERDIINLLSVTCIPIKSSKQIVSL